MFCSLLMFVCNVILSSPTEYAHTLQTISHSHTPLSLILLTQVLTHHQTLWRNIEFIFNIPASRRLSFPFPSLSPSQHMISAPTSVPRCFLISATVIFGLLLMAARYTSRSAPAVQRAWTGIVHPPPPPPPYARHSDRRPHHL